MKERKRKKAVEEIMKLIGVKLKVEEVWKIADDKKKGKELVGVRVEKKETRREIWEKKGIEREKKEDCRRLDVGREEDKMELGEDSKRGGRERNGMDWIWEDKNRRAMVEMR